MLQIIAIWPVTKFFPIHASHPTCYEFLPSPPPSYLSNTLLFFISSTLALVWVLACFFMYTVKTSSVVGICRLFRHLFLYFGNVFIFIRQKPKTGFPSIPCSQDIDIDLASIKHPHRRLWMRCDSVKLVPHWIAQQRWGQNLLVSRNRLPQSHAQHRCPVMAQWWWWRHHHCSCSQMWLGPGCWLHNSCWVLQEILGLIDYPLISHVLLKPAWMFFCYSTLRTLFRQDFSFKQ